VLTDGAVRTVSGKLFQMRGAVELKAWRLANTVLSAGWESNSFGTRQAGLAGKYRLGYMGG